MRKLFFSFLLHLYFTSFLGKIYERTQKGKKPQKIYCNVKMLLVVLRRCLVRHLSKADVELSMRGHSFVFGCEAPLLLCILGALQGITGL